VTTKDASTASHADGDPAPGSLDLDRYDGMDNDGLRAEARKLGVEINLDVEKAILVHDLRAHDLDTSTVASEDNYDLTPLTELRKLAAKAGVGLSPGQERDHLLTELRAHQTGAPATAQPGKGAAHARADQ
jgi:hypothetical protein